MAKGGSYDFVLDAEGQGVSELKNAQQPMGFILSDDQPFSENDLHIVNDEVQLSLGRQWLQGHACISIIHHVLDQELSHAG